MKQKSVNAAQVTAAVMALVTELFLLLRPEFQFFRNGGISGVLLDLAKCFKPKPLIDLVLWIGLYKVYRFVLQQLKETEAQKRTALCAAMCALILSIFYTAGAAYENRSPECLFGSSLQVFKSIISICGVEGILFGILVILWNRPNTLLKNDSPKTKKAGSLLSLYQRHLAQRPFLTAFVTLFISYALQIVLFYPGILMGDTPLELAEGFQMETYKPSVQLQYKGSRLTNHHPILHVMFLHFCMQAGIHAFHSWNAGILIYVLFQELLFLSVVSLSLSELKERGLSVTGCTLYIFFFSFHPIIQNYINLVTKDVIYASFLLLFILSLSRNANKVREKKYNAVLMLIASVGMMLFRNEGIYVLFLAYFSAFLLFKKRRHQYLIWLAVIGILYAGWINIALPFFRVSPGSIREMLSVPFMQTARIVKLFPEDITPEEEEAIRSVLDYERLPELYDERSADMVKATFKNENKDNLRSFLKAWGSISKRHPEAFFDAFFYWKYDFFYPSERLSEQTYNYTNCYEFIHQTVTWYCKPLEPNLVQPVRLRRAARFLEEMRKVILCTPIFDSLGSAAAYVWLMVIAGFDAIRRKKRIGILMLIPLSAGLAAGLVGPTAATYFRYMFSNVVALPFVIGYISIENQPCHQKPV